MHRVRTAIAGASVGLVAGAAVLLPAAPAAAATVGRCLRRRRREPGPRARWGGGHLHHRRDERRAGHRRPRHADRSAAGRAVAGVGQRGRRDLRRGPHRCVHDRIAEQRGLSDRDHRRAAAGRPRRQLAVRVELDRRPDAVQQLIRAEDDVPRLRRRLHRERHVAQRSTDGRRATTSSVASGATTGSRDAEATTH